MNKKTLQVAKAVEGHLGESELADWWRVMINSELRKENGRTLSTKQLAQAFRALRKLFKIEKTTKYVGRKPFMFYSIGRK